MTRNEIRILRATFNEDFVKPLQELREFLLEDKPVTAIATDSANKKECIHGN